MKDFNDTRVCCMTCLFYGDDTGVNIEIKGIYYPMFDIHLCQKTGKKMDRNEKCTRWQEDRNFMQLVRDNVRDKRSLEYYQELTKEGERKIDQE